MITNADELYVAMHETVWKSSKGRTVDDEESPQKGHTREATFQSFTLCHPFWNLVTLRDLNLPWAVANVLHFFSGSEEAGWLRQYNPLADKFLTGDRWIGAYGKVGMPQLNHCMSLLNDHRSTRRAVVTLTQASWPHLADVNVPSCPTCLHFLAEGTTLSLGVYQRSLNLRSVMPYDLVLFGNILNYVCAKTKMMVGNLHWFVGSLHLAEDHAYDTIKLAIPTKGASLLLSSDVLRDPIPWFNKCKELI